MKNSIYAVCLYGLITGSVATAQDRDAVENQDAVARDQNAVAEEEPGFEGAARDAWITGKIETVMLLNTQLNSFAIGTDVEQGRVTLSGSVDTQIDKDLAEQLTQGIVGVEGVENNIRVMPDELQESDRDTDVGTAANRDVAGARTGAGDDIATADESRDRNQLSQWVSDTTTTAVVKSKLLANDETEGLQINVDTENNVVTLTGTVESEQAKQTAEELARETGDVADVRNNLEIDTPTAG
ncbi:MAG: BON domain-containing protein [Pseudohongiellaceae bacterium]